MCFFIIIKFYIVINISVCFKVPLSLQLDALEKV